MGQEPHLPGWGAVLVSLNPPAESEQPVKNDPIDPNHYKLLTPEPISVIEGWNLGFYAAQVVKYLARAGRKGGPEKLVEDLKKAAWYLNRWIARLESK